MPMPHKHGLEICGTGRLPSSESVTSGETEQLLHFRVLPIALPRLTARRAATIEPMMQKLIRKASALKHRSPSHSSALSSMRTSPSPVMTCDCSPRSPNATRWSLKHPVRQQLQIEWPNSLRRSKALRRQGKALPARTSRSESESNSSGWLRRVRPAVSVECPDAKIDILVNVAPVLSEQRQVSCQRVINANAI